MITSWPAFGSRFRFWPILPRRVPARQGFSDKNCLLLPPCGPASLRESSHTHPLSRLPSPPEASTEVSVTWHISGRPGRTRPFLRLCHSCGGRNPDSVGQRLSPIREHTRAADVGWTPASAGVTGPTDREATRAIPDRIFSLWETPTRQRAFNAFRVPAEGGQAHRATRGCAPPCDISHAAIGGYEQAEEKSCSHKATKPRR
jgi:hypothetical protein